MELLRTCIRNLLLEDLDTIRDLSIPDQVTTIDEYDTIGEVLEALQVLIDSRRENRLNSTFIQTALEVPKATIVGPIIVAAEFFGRIRDDRKNKPKSADIDLIEEFPVLDLLDIHPTFFEVLDDSLLDDVQHIYMSQVIEKLKPSDPVSALVDVNDFIQKYLKWVYDVTFKLEPIKSTVH